MQPTYESPFARALASESRYLAVIPGLPMPSDSFAGRRVYIGPVRLPFYGTHYLSPLNADLAPDQPDQPPQPPATPI